MNYFFSGITLRDLQTLFGRGLNTWEAAPPLMLKVCDWLTERDADSVIEIRDLDYSTDRASPDNTPLRTDIRISALQSQVQTLQQALIKLALLQTDAEKLQCLGEALRATAPNPCNNSTPN